MPENTVQQKCGTCYWFKPDQYGHGGRCGWRDWASGVEFTWFTTPLISPDFGTKCLQWRKKKENKDGDTQKTQDDESQH